MVEDGPYPVYGANGVIGRYHSFNHEESEVLLGCRGSCGSVNVSEPQSWVTGNAMVIKPRDRRLSKEFLRYFLDGSGEIAKTITGVAQPQITQKSLAPVSIPLPPIEEQRRIVAVLDEAFAGLAVAVESAEQNFRNARELYTVALDEEIGAGFPEASMKEICSFENGDRGENYAGRSSFVSEGIPVISAGHLSEDGIDTETMNFINRERFDLLRSGKIKRGDFLFCLRGSLGKFAYNNVYDEGAIASSLIIVRPNERVVPDYLLLYFGSNCCATMIEHYKNGTAQPNLGGKSLEKFKVPLPARRQQEAIVDRLQRLRETTRALATTYSDKLSQLTALKQSLLEAAVTGQLARSSSPSSEQIRLDRIKQVATALSGNCSGVQEILPF
jgi:type I restriction enzyme S subunit